MKKDLLVNDFIRLDEKSKLYYSEKGDDKLMKYMS